MRKPQALFLSLLVLSVCFFVQLHFNLIPLVQATDTTITISNTMDDGDVYGSSTTYATAWATGTYAETTTSLYGDAGQRKLSTTFYVHRRMLNFNGTSAIPAGATITAAKLECNYTMIQTNNANFTIKVQKWTGTVPITTADYTQNDSTVYDDGLLQTQNMANNSLYNITFTNFGCINAGSNTTLMLRSSLDIAATTPTGTGTLKQYVIIGDKSDSSQPPKLYLTYLAPAPTLNYASPANNTQTKTHNETINIAANWTSSNTLNNYQFNWKNSSVGTWNNGSWINFGASTWSNTSFTPNDTTTTCNYYYWEVIANDTTNSQGCTGLYQFYNIETRPSGGTFDVGDYMQTGGSQAYFNGTSGGGLECLYIGYMNSSSTVWNYSLRVFEFSNRTWYDFTMEQVYSADGHFRPSISVLPDGRLVYVYGRDSYVPLTIKVSSNNASTESNLTKLCTEWSSYTSDNAKIYPIWQSITSYPWMVKTNNTVVLFGRDGDAEAGNYTYWRWVDKSWGYIQIKSHTLISLVGAQMVGEEPCFDEFNSSYVRFYGPSNGEAEHWTFTDAYFDQYYGNVTLELLCNKTSSGNLLVPSINNGTGWTQFLNPTPTIPTGPLAWVSWNVTASFGDSSPLQTASCQLRLNTSSMGPSDQIFVYAARLKVNMTGFESARRWLYTAAKQAPYVEYPNYANDTLFAPFKIRGVVANQTELRKDLYLLYSQDSGVSWRFSNGSVANFPIKGEDCLVSAVGYYPATTIAGLTKENQLFVPFSMQNWTQDWQYPRIALYSATLGNVGTYTVYNLTCNDQVLWSRQYFGASAPIFQIDPYYKRLAFWYSSNYTNYRLAKYVCSPSNYTDVLCVWNDTVDTYRELIAGDNIQDSPTFYDSIMQRLMECVGEDEKQATQTAITQLTMVACQFTVNFTGRIDFITYYINSTGETVYGCSGIYNSSGYLMGNSTQTQIIDHSGAWWAYNENFGTGINVTQNETCYLAFIIGGFATNKNVSYAYKNSVTINQTWTKYVGSYDFPSSLDFSSGTYLNQTVSLFAIHKIHQCKGFGLPPTLTLVGSNNTIGGELTLFYGYAQSGVNLYLAQFYWNYTGTTQQNGTLTLTTTDEWCNFTRTIPQFRQRLTWFIVIYDILENVGNTSEQYVDIAANVTIAFTETASLSSSYSVGKEGASSQVQTIILSTSTPIANMERFFYGTETISEINFVTWDKEQLFSISSILNSLASIFMNREIIAQEVEYTFIDAGALSQVIFVSKERSFSSIGTLTLNMLGVTSKEILYVNVQTMSFLSDIMLGLERSFLQTQLFTLNSTSAWSMERLFTQTSPLSLIANFNMNRESSIIEEAYTFTDIDMLSQVIFVNKERSFVPAVSLVIDSLVGMGRELGFATTQTLTILSQPLTNLERWFIQTVTLTSQNWIIQLHENLYGNVHTVTTVETSGVGKETSMIEMTLTITEPLNVSSVLILAKEILVTQPATMLLDWLSTMAKEVVIHELEVTIVDTATVSGVLYWNVVLPPGEGISQLGFAMLFLIIGLILGALVLSDLGAKED